MKPKWFTLFSLLILTSLLSGACASAGSTPPVENTPTNAPVVENTPTNTPLAATPTQTEAAATAIEANVEATPTPVSEAEPFKAWLSENIAARNFDELEKLMGSEFYFGMLHSDSGMETQANAIRLLQGFFGENHVEFVPPQEAASLLKDDPLARLGPEVKNPDFFLARNVGTAGKDGAILYIAQKPDGSYYWYGLLVARGGF
jgi:hypothetical protein